MDRTRVRNAYNGPGGGTAAAGGLSSVGFARLCVLAGVVSVLFFVWLLLKVGGTQVTEDVDDLGELVAALAAAGACFFASRGRVGRIGLGWHLLGLSALSWGVGEAIWCYYEVLIGRQLPFPSLADAGFLVAVPLALAGVLTFFCAPVGLTSRLRAIVDALIVASAMLLVSWLTVLGPVYNAPRARMVYRGTGSVLAQTIALAYPVGDLVILSAVVIVAGRSRSTDQLPLAWIGVAIAGLAISDSGFAYLIQEGAYGASQLVDTGWVAGFLVLALAAIKPPTSKQRRTRTSDLVLLPYVPVVCAIVVLGVRGLNGEPLGAFACWNLLAVFCFVVVRQVLALRENHALTSDLEAKVQVRTLELRKSEQRLRSLIESVSDMISVVSADGTIVYISPSVRDVLGYSPVDLTGASLFDLVHPEDRAQAAAFFADRLRTATAGQRLELRLHGRDGRWRHTETIAAEAVDEPGLDRFVLATRDTTDRRQFEQQLAHQAFHDPLTDLANRSLFCDRVDHGLACGRRSGSQLAVMFIDLDQFKAVNDTLGHAPGDELLREVAARLSASVRQGDTVARLGGDEFAVLMGVCDEHEAVQAAERFKLALAAPIELDGNSVIISASAGIAMGGTSTESVDELLRNADIAMYHAKALGSGHELFRSRDAQSDRTAGQPAKRSARRAGARRTLSPLPAARRALHRAHHRLRGAVPLASSEPGERAAARVHPRC